MHGLEFLIGYVFLGCLITAFVVQLALNRRPFVVAFAVTIGLYLLAMSGLAVVDGRVNSIDASLGFVLFVFPGTIGSLIGSGIARAIRMWAEIYREPSTPED